MSEQLPLQLGSLTMNVWPRNELATAVSWTLASEHSSPASDPEELARHRISIY
jgi:hypothetical protein